MNSRLIRIIALTAVFVLLLLFLFRIGRYAISLGIFSTIFVIVIVGKWLTKRR